MTTEEFKEYALRTMLEENLWKVGESDIFTFMGVRYQIYRHLNYFDLSTFNVAKNDWNTPKSFKRLTELFREIFRTWQIKY